MHVNTRISCLIYWHRIALQSGHWQLGLYQSYDMDKKMWTAGNDSTVVVIVVVLTLSHHSQILQSNAKQTS